MMSSTPDSPRPLRFAEFLRRLSEAPAASNHDEAFQQIADILNAVENEMTSIPYDPSKWQTDGRMYPPQPDARRRVKGRSDVVRYRSKAHNTFVCANGAIRIEKQSGEVILSKPGSDGESL